MAWVIIVIDIFPIELSEMMFNFKIKMIDPLKNILIEQSLKIPTRKKKQNAVYHSIGTGFMNLEVPLPPNDNDAELIISTCNKTNLNENSSRKTNIISMSTPQILVKKSVTETSRVLIVTMESLTDYLILQNKFYNVAESHIFEIFKCKWIYTVCRA